MKRNIKIKAVSKYDIDLEELKENNILNIDFGDIKKSKKYSNKIEGKVKHELNMTSVMVTISDSDYHTAKVIKYLDKSILEENNNVPYDINFYMRLLSAAFTDVTFIVKIKTDNLKIKICYSNEEIIDIKVKKNINNKNLLNNYSILSDSVDVYEPSLRKVVDIDLIENDLDKKNFNKLSQNLIKSLIG